MDLIRWGEQSFGPVPGVRESAGRDQPPHRGRQGRAEPRGLFERTFSPAIDVLESDDRFDVVYDMPGIEITDVEISIAGNVFTIKGKRKARASPGNGNVYKADTKLGRFQRTVQLPLPVDPDQVDAILKDGVLQIALPKNEELKPRQISVKAK